MSVVTLPAMDPGLGADLDSAQHILGGKRLAVLTGAGVSTDSGIPDYRGAGTRIRQPMTIQTFMSDPRARQRYWAGSHLGWRHFANAEPNRGHAALADLEVAGTINGVITQNVDGLHLRAGSRHVVDVHGSIDRVTCLRCGQQFARDAIASRMTSDNPWLAEPDSVQLNPDGDVEVAAIEDMVVPSCSVCDGVLKPDLVFFGEFVPPGKFAEATALIRGADALLVAGSSLAVNSGIRLVDQAVKRRLPVVIINRGETKGDSRAALKIDGGTTEVLEALRDRLS